MFTSYQGVSSAHSLALNFLIISNAYVIVIKKVTKFLFFFVESYSLHWPIVCHMHIPRRLTVHAQIHVRVAYLFLIGKDD